MRSVFTLLVVLTIAVSARGAEFRFPPHTITVADGFEVVQAAAPPLIERPMLACFDDEGRLYVCDSAGVNARGDELKKNPPDTIRRLEDTNGDGVFDRSTPFAERLLFPQGIAWHRGMVFVAAPPEFLRLEDTDGDGKADKRTVLLEGFPLTGCADDMHGATVGPDGFVYTFTGRFPHKVRAPGGPVLHEGTAPMMFRCLPDGSRAEAFCGVLGNAVGIAFDEAGEGFVCGTFMAPDSMGAGLRDGLIHVVEGAVFPVRDRDLKERRKTGPLLPPLVHMGASASSDLCLLRSDGLGDGFRGNLLSTAFNMRKVARHVLTKDRSSYTAKTEDFLVSDHFDFHPTDVLEDADGSVLVLDTGAWFRICCPTSQIGKPQVLGAIYRVRRKGAPAVQDPRGNSLPWTKAVPAAARATLSDKDSSVRLVAARVAGLFRDASSANVLRKSVLEDPDLAVRREAAISLGRLRNADAVPDLLAALDTLDDPHGRHAVIYALEEIADHAGLAKGLEAKSSRVRRGALIALDQIGAEELRAQDVIPLLESEDPLLAETATWIVERRDAWGAEIAQWLSGLLDRKGERLENAQTVARAMKPLLRMGAVQELVAKRLSESPEQSSQRLTLLDAMAAANLGRLPASWSAPLRVVLASKSTCEAGKALAALRTVPGKELGGFTADFETLARDEKRDDRLRLEALSAISGKPSADPKDFSLVLGCLSSNDSSARLLAAEVLTRRLLDPAQMVELAGRIERSGPFELPRLLECFEGASDAALGLKLVEALERNSGIASLRADTVQKALAKFPGEVQTKLEALLETIGQSLKERKAKLDALAPKLSEGDATRGQMLFNASRLSCFGCHRTGHLGGEIGPDLTRIGNIRSERDLLEAILFPSSTFARGYEVSVVAMKDGQQQIGLVREETSDSFLLITSATSRQRLRRDDVREIAPSPLSVMPQGLDQQMSAEELADLVAFLKSLR